MKSIDKMDGIAIAGLTVLSVGCGMVWLPLAFIVPGVAIVAWVFALTALR